MPDNSFIQPTGAGRELVYAGTDVGIPAATVLGASATVTSNLMNSFGAKSLEVNAQASQTSNLILTGFGDAAGTQQVWKETVAMTAATNAFAYAPAIPFVTWQIQIANQTGSAGTCVVNSAVAQN